LTAPAPTFVPSTEIFFDCHGKARAAKGDLDGSLEAGVLNVEGPSIFDSYADLQPVYTEYNIGNDRRSVSLSSTIDQNKISAEMTAGVLTWCLPKSRTPSPGVSVP